MEVSNQIAQWVPPGILAAGFLWLIIDKHREIMSKFLEMNLAVNKLSGTAVDLKTALIELKMQLGQMVTMEHHHKSINDVKSEIATLRERVIKLEER